MTTQELDGGMKMLEGQLDSGAIPLRIGWRYEDARRAIGFWSYTAERRSEETMKTMKLCREVDDLNQLEKIMVAWLNRTEARLGQINDAGIVERNRHLQNHCLEPQKIQVEGILKWTVLLMS
ncbi:hypothetical protein QE152_g13173 [Popillia japonica]|uniref:Uncharacterized protein n=1 Tax=Popillia japonica TaxID=7064 RepID=A0AAW1LDF4_POPJA